MSDIDYSKYSYKNSKGGRNMRQQKGKLRYKFANYETYINDVREVSQSMDEAEHNEIYELNGDLGRDEIVVNHEEKRINEEDIVDIYNIQDIRTKKKTYDSQEPEMNEPRDTGRKGRVNRKGDIIAVLMIVLCFALTIASTDIITGGGIFNNLVGVFANESDSNKYFAVDVGSYPDMDSAKATSELLRSRSAGGYVIEDKSYHVIAAVYKDRRDAEAIVTKLIQDGIAASIYELKIETVDYTNYQVTGEHIEKAMDDCRGIYDTLYQVSNKLDKEEITKAEARIEIIKLRNEIERVLNAFITNTRTYDEEVLLKVRTEITSYVAILENLTVNGNDRASMVSDIRYSYTMILNMYCALTRAL